MQEKAQKSQISEIKIDLDQNKNEIIKDKYHLVYIFFFVMGMVHFIPWSFFTTSTEYWMYKFRNTTLPDDALAEDRTTLQSVFTASINAVLAGSTVVFHTINVLFGHYIQLKTRLIGTLILMLINFLILSAFVLIDTDSYQTIFLILTLSIVAIVSAINSLLSVTMYTHLSQFPNEYLIIYMVTDPLSKVFTSFIEIVSHLLGLNVVDSGLVYFLVGAVVIIISGCFAYYIINYNEYYIVHMQHFKESSENSLTWNDSKIMCKKLWTNFVALGLVTLVAQAPINLVVSEFETQGQWPDVFFIPTISFLLVSVLDWLGREFTVIIPPLNFGKYQFMLATLVNLIVFYPMIFYCNAQPRPNGTPVLFPHDYQYIVILVFHSIVRGYLTSLCSLNIPKFLTREELKHGYHMFLIITGVVLALVAPITLLTVELL